MTKVFRQALRPHLDDIYCMCKWGGKKWFFIILVITDDVIPNYVPIEKKDNFTEAEIDVSWSFLDVSMSGPLTVKNGDINLYFLVKVLDSYWNLGDCSLTNTQVCVV